MFSSQHIVPAAILILAAAFPNWTAAQDWVRLPEKSRDVTIEGQQLKIVIRPEIRFTDGPANNIIADLRAYVHLEDLQNKAPALLRVLAEKKSDCDTRWSFPSMAPVIVQNGKLKIAGQVRLEKWACVGPLKTRLARETADFVIALYPSNQTSEVVMKAELERFDLGNSLLGGFENQLRDMLSGQLDEVFARDDMKLRFPPEVASINPRFAAAEIKDAGGGKGELFMEAQATIRASEMTKILSLIAKQN
jgi:hypothetical protein